MESEEDVLNLFASLDIWHAPLCSSWRNPGICDICPRLVRANVAKEYKYDYSLIPRLKENCELLERRYRELAQNNPQAPDETEISTRDNAHRKWQDVEERLRFLIEGHRQISRNLAPLIANFLRLPRELRDMVYQNLYVKPDCSGRYCIWHNCSVGDYVILGRPEEHFGSTLYIPPRDPYLLMSAQHVGPIVAAEAAKFCYSHNTFIIDPLPCLKGFLETDYYGSGEVPLNCVKRLALLVSLISTGDKDQLWTNDDVAFEEVYREYELTERVDPPCRSLLEILLSMRNLRHIIIHIEFPQFSENRASRKLLALRILSPTIFRLRENGVDAEVRYCCPYGHSWVPRYNTCTDWCQRYCQHCRNITYYFSPGAKVSKSNLSPFRDANKAARCQSRLLEHYKVYQRIEEEQTKRHAS